MIRDDKPKDAPQASPEERDFIFDKLAKYFPKDRVLVLEGEHRRGEKKKNK